MPSPPEYRDLVEKPMAFEKTALETTSDEMDETSLSVEQILSLGKQRAAEYLKSSHSNDLINKILDEIFANELDIDWIKWLIAGGISPDEFGYQVKQYNKATICGLVWTTNHVAYRCKTCNIFPCMSLCVECFQRGHHEEHDFNMFRSQSGGACDCGDASVMHSSGFCDRHGVAKDSENIEVPPDLMEVAHVIAPRILFEFIKYLRNLSSHDDKYVPIADNFLSMLIEFSNMGSVMREVLTKALINRQEYQKFTCDWVKDDSQFAQNMAASQKLYENALESLKNLEPPAQFKDCRGLQKELIHNTFLDELFFWTVKYEFPEKIVYFLLNMLPDIDYKDALTETFVMHYSRIAMILECTQDPDALPHRVVHLNVQLFYRENLAVRMTNEFGILYIMVVSLKNMMSKILKSSNLSNKSEGEDALMIVDCGLPLIKECRYWPLVSDLNNILFREPVARQFMSNDMLIEMWFSFLNYFQGMNITRRELKDHVEFESNLYNGAFLAELDASAYPMWRLLSHLNNENSIPLLQRLLKHCLVSLETWIEKTNGTSDSFRENLVSFHIPLHRYFAMLVCQAVNVLQIPLSEVLPTNSSIYSIMKHPLRIQVAFYEIINDLWARNGLQIKGQAMNYIHSDFCNSMMDADLYLLQVLSTRLPASEFMSGLIEKFHIKNWFKFFNKTETSNVTNNDIDSDTKMLESFLHFLVTMCSIRTNLAGVTNYEFEGCTFPIQTRSEIVTLLCVSDKPHSRLKELMPDRCGTDPLRHFDAILAQIADYKAPITDVNGTLQQALYIPKSHIWESLYDPIHVLLRVPREDFQNSMNRFTEYVKQNNLLADGAIPWPPYRIPAECKSSYQDPRSILQSKVFHAIIWIVLYKAVYMKNVPEGVVSLAVYLLELALSLEQAQNHEDCLKDYSQNNKNWVDVSYLELEKWFSSDRLSTNSRTNVRYVMIPSSQKRDNSKSEPRDQNISYLSSNGSSIVQTFSQTNRKKQRGKSNAGASSVPKNPSSPHVKKLSANESIISMLLKLYSNLCTNIDSFTPESIQSEEINNRIGDGAAFIAKVLKRITLLDDLCREEVVQCCHRLCPQRSSRDNDKKDLEEKEESERKRIARERRQKIIEKYAHQREEFLKKNINEDNKMDCEEVALKEYHCVICKETSPSRSDMPMGLVVLVQPTNVLGHRRRTNDRPILPVCDEDLVNFSHQRTLVRDFEKKTRQFTDIPFRRNGVYVQTCGHYLHLECLKSHLQWLKDQQQKSAVDELELLKDEYQCPLCRQLANNVIPVLPDSLESSVISGPLISDRNESIVKKINDLIINAECSNYSPEERLCDDSIMSSTNLMIAIKKSIDDIIESTYSNLKQTHELKRDSSMLQFIASMARSNLEIELIQRGGSLLKPAHQSSTSNDFPASLVSKRSCLAPLLHILAARARSLDYTSVLEIWQRLSNGVVEVQDLSKNSNSSQDVPLLLQDPTELLVQLVLHLPLNVDRAYFNCIAKLSFSLMYFQILAQISNHLEESERNYFRTIDSTSSIPGSVEKFSLDLGMKFTILSMELKQDCISLTTLKEPLRQNLELQIQELCLPFLRIACMLRHYMYEDLLPDITSQQNEFQCLIEYLDLIQSPNQSPCDSASAISWNDSTFVVINSWFEDFSRYVSKQQFQLSELHVSWKPPRLLELPRKYSVLFQYYHDKACSNCDQIPQKGAICLVCGALICFQQNCCKQGEINETVQHSMDCGSGTAIFLMISSTCVVIIRGKRACIWGSIYLDAFGEEDIELKRGKPLFLSEERYQLLEQQWLLHRFDHTSKKWIMHRDSL